MTNKNNHNTPAIKVTCQLNRAGFALNLDLELPAKGITAIFGQSGSGKTTLLRIIAGLEQVAGSEVHLGHVCWQSGDNFVPTYKRQLGYVFQEANLFSHLTAQQNLDYAIKRADEKVDAQYITQIIDLLGISSILSQYPAQLSGGEAQRVAIARALLIKPKLLLMDEPLASLDDAKKADILPYLERLHSELNMPILYVSHSMQEVARLADHAVVLQEGKVIVEGELTQVFSQLNLPEYIAKGTIISGKITEYDDKWQLAKLTFVGGYFWLAKQNIINPEDVRVQILAKDVALSLSCPAETSVQNKISAQIVDIQTAQEPTTLLVKLAIGESAIIAQVTKKSVQTLSLTPGKKVWAMIKTMAIVR